MTRNRTVSLLMGVAGAGMVLAALLFRLPGLALWTGLGGLLAGMAAASRGAPAPPPPHAVAVAATPEEPALPQDLIDAFDDPLLLVAERRVVLANRSATALLGSHIVGADLRLAIRHPAAAELLAQPLPPTPARIDLTGLGQPDQRWEMLVAELPDGRRLVRLADRGQAQAEAQARVDFVANASHELRTPLTALLGFIETLQDDGAGGDRGTRQRFLGIMAAEAERMRRLVDDLMSLSRVQAERFQPPAETIDLAALMRDVQGAVAHLLERHGGSLTVKGAGTVTGDRGQLCQLFANLIGNALQHGREGGTVHVAIAEAGRELVRVSVADEGEGIAPEHLPRLTERFYRVDPGRSRAGGGTGLGLAIAKHIVARHRGRLDIRSEPGVGTTVSVDLPHAAAASPQAAVIKA